MIVDLSVGLNTDEVDNLVWEEVESVIHTATSAKELAKQLADLKLATPSEAFDEDGDYLWDYKDSSSFYFNTLSQVAHAVEGLTITGQSEGPRYWFVAFIYNGEESGIGPGYQEG